MKILVSFITGAIFGLGLILSGMTDPSKVIGFLDLTGVWDPSLAFVMGGAVLVGTVAFRLAKGRSKAILGDAFKIPTTRQINARLVLGGLTFGAGWGLAGYCPGPVLASVVQGGSKPLIFVIAMLAGMAVFEMQGRLATLRERKAA